MKTLNVLLATAALALATFTLAGAQTATIYNDSGCGTWQGDNWVPSGNCPQDTHKHARVEGTIVSVKGHLVTIQQATGQLTIDDTPALNNQFTGKVAVGRRIVAHGYWDSNNFYATIIMTDSPSS